MPAASRLGDPIEHSNALTGLLLGAAAGAVIGALAVATGGAALVVAAAVVGGAAAGAGIGQVLGSLDVVGSVVTGSITTGSPDVLINGLHAVGAHFTNGDLTLCGGPPPFGWPNHLTPFVAQGSETVSLNGQPASRKGDMIECGASIGKGSRDVTIGGAPVSTMAIGSEVPDWMNTVLLGAGLGAAVILGGPVVAIFGLAGSIGGQSAGEWVARKFNLGSDWQKIMGLVGSLVGGGLGAKGAAGGWFRLPKNASGVRMKFRGKHAIDLRPANLIGNRIGGRVGGFVRAGAQGVGSRGGVALQRAQSEAARIRSNGKEHTNARRAVTAVVDRTNPEHVVIENSSNADSPQPTRTDLHPDLRPRFDAMMKEHSTRKRENWPPNACAEVKALNRAMKENEAAGPPGHGARVEDFEIATVETASGQPMHRCNYCAHTTDGARVTTDRATPGAPGAIIGGSSADSDP